MSSNYNKNKLKYTVKKEARAWKLVNGKKELVAKCENIDRETFKSRLTLAGIDFDGIDTLLSFPRKEN